MSSTSATATRDRPDATDERIVTATVDMLRDHGPAAVNIEAVATVSGVAKTTIYRRYTDRDALLRAALRHASKAVPIPTDLPTYETLRWMLTRACVLAENVLGRGVIATVLVDDDPALASALHEMIKTRSSSVTTLLRERQAAGELRADLDMDLVAGLLLGAFVGQLVRGHEADADWADKILDLLWPTLTP